MNFIMFFNIMIYNYFMVELFEDFNKCGGFVVMLNVDYMVKL